MGRVDVVEWTRHHRLGIEAVGAGAGIAARPERIVDPGAEPAGTVSWKDGDGIPPSHEDREIGVPVGGELVEENRSRRRVPRIGPGKGECLPGAESPRSRSLQEIDLVDVVAGGRVHDVPQRHEHSRADEAHENGDDRDNDHQLDQREAGASRHSQGSLGLLHGP